MVNDEQKLDYFKAYLDVLEDKMDNNIYLLNKLYKIRKELMYNKFQIDYLEYGNLILQLVDYANILISETEEIIFPSMYNSFSFF